MDINRLAKLGYPVMPVERPPVVPLDQITDEDRKKGKRPITPKGCYDGTTDAEIIEGWKNNPRYKDCNWGIWCRDLFVIDVDGEKGKESLAKLEEELGPLPYAPIVNTGGGGKHILFKKPEGKFTAKVDRSLKIDIRTGGTIIVAPGSIHVTGNYYTEDEDHPLCPVENLPTLPQVWLDRLQKTKHQASNTTAKVAEICDGDYDDCATYVSTMDTFTEGDGGKKLMHVCSVIFVEFGFDKNDWKARAILNDYLANVRHDDGSKYEWEPDDVERKINEVIRLGTKHTFGFRRRRSQFQKAKDIPLDFTINGKPIDEQTKEEPKEQFGLALLRGDEIEMTPETWLWEDRIPLGHFTNVFGVGGIGKSAIVFDWAARVTSGKEWADKKPNQVGSVLYFSMEQDEIDARAKLELWGGNIKNFYIVKGTWKKKGKIEIFDLSQLMELKYTLQQFRDDPNRPDVRLIVIDPIISALGKVNDSSQSDIRNMLEPVRPILKEYDVACIYICHSRKPTVNFKESSKDRCAGSQAFTSLARVSYEVIEELEGNEELPVWEVPRVMLCAKRNGAVLPKGVYYHFTEPMAWPELMNRKLSMIEYDDHSVDMMMDTYSANREREKKEEKSKNIKSALNAAETWLFNVLQDGPRPVGKAESDRTADSICYLGEHHDPPFGYKTLQRAAAELHVYSHQDNGRRVWELQPTELPTECVSREWDEQDSYDSID